LPTSDPNPEAASSRPFAETLAELNSGAVSDEMSVKLADLVCAVQATGKKGSLTLTITIAPYKGNSRTVEIAASTTVKKPVDHPHAGVFFAGTNGQLSRNDPQQPTLPLVDAPRAGAERTLA
jgi:hypothetical protein